MEAVVIPAVCLSTLVRDNLYVENFLYRGATQHFSQVLTAVEQHAVPHIGAAAGGLLAGGV